MGLDEWNTILQVASVVVLGATFLIGAGALWTSYVVNKRQAERIATLERDTADALKSVAETNERTQKLELEAAVQRERAAKADERAAKAELALAELMRRTTPKEVNT